MGIDALEAKICAQTSDTLRDNLRSKDVLSTSEAAKYLGVCRTTVSRYLALGMLPGVARPNCTNVSIRSREPVPLLKNAQ